jgi:hypothetical protein
VPAVHAQCIALLVLIAYWPLSTFSWSITAGDALNCWLPWRHFIGQSLAEGQFPLWNPYQQGGYPIYADLQGPAWSIEALAVGGTVGHSVFTLQALYLVYMIIGGWGMRRLALRLTDTPPAALMAGIAFALCGFFTAHGQHFYSIISGAWLPWLLWAHLLLLDSPGWKSAARLALVGAQLLTSGNHFFAVMVAYPMLALTAARAWAIWRARNPAALLRLAKWCSIALLLLTVMVCGTVLSAIEVWPHFTRQSGLGVEVTGQNPLFFEALLTVLAPYANGADLVRTGADGSMTNAWFGALMLCAASVTLLRMRRAPTEQWVLLAFAAICALCAFGERLPVYGWAHALVPGVRLFRFPSYFWFFVALIALPYGCAALIGAAQGDRDIRRWLRIALIGGIGCTVLLLIAALVEHQGPWRLIAPQPSLRDRMLAPAPWERIAWSAGITVLIGLGGLLLLRRRAGISAWLALVSIEMLVAVQFTQWNTSLFRPSPLAIQERIDERAFGPVLPELVSINDWNDGPRELHHLWINTQTLLARPSQQGFNSFWLWRNDSLREHALPMLGFLGRRPWAFFADTASAGSIEVLDFHHNGFTLRTHSQRGERLVAQQTPYPGWAATVDGAPASITPAYTTCQSVELPPGTHEVVFRFTRPWTHLALWASMLAQFVALLLLALSSSGAMRWPGVLAVLTLAMAVAWPFACNQPKSERIERALPEVKARVDAALEDRDRVVINTDRPLQWIDERAAFTRATGFSALDRVQAAVGASPQRITWIDVGLKMPREVEAWFAAGYRLMEDERLGKDTRIRRLVRVTKDAAAEPANDARFDPPVALHGVHWAYGKALELAPDSVPHAREAQVVLRAEIRAEHAVDLNWVIERLWRDSLIAYEAVPMHVEAMADSEWHALAITRPLAWRPGLDERLRSYLWNTTADTLLLRRFNLEAGVDAGRLVQGR